MIDSRPVSAAAFASRDISSRAGPARDPGTDVLDILVRRFEAFIARTEAVMLTDGPAPLLAVITQVSDQFRTHLADLDRLRSIPGPAAVPGARVAENGRGPARVGDTSETAASDAGPDGFGAALARASRRVPESDSGAASAAPEASPAERATGMAGANAADGGAAGVSGLSPHMTAGNADAADVIAHELATIASEIEAISGGATTEDRAGDGRLIALRQIAVAVLSAGTRVREAG